MNEKENDPRTSFQEGTPLPASAPRDDDEPLEVAGPSKLDQVVEAIKEYERWGLVVGIGVQLLVLFSMIMMGAMQR